MTTFEQTPTALEADSDISPSKDVNVPLATTSKRAPSRSTSRGTGLKVFNWVNTAPQNFDTKTAMQPKQRRRRTNREELSILEAAFQENHLPDARARELLAEKLAMTTRAVQVWFQNKRQTMRKRVTMTATDAGNYQETDEIYQETDTTYQESEESDSVDHGSDSIDQEANQEASKVNQEANPIHQRATKLTKQKANTVNNEAGAVNQELNRVNEDIYPAGEKANQKVGQKANVDRDSRPCSGVSAVPDKVTDNFEALVYAAASEKSIVLDLIHDKNKEVIDGSQYSDYINHNVADITNIPTISEKVSASALVSLSCNHSFSSSTTPIRPFPPIHSTSGPRHGSWAHKDRDIHRITHEASKSASRTHKDRDIHRVNSDITKPASRAHKDCDIHRVNSVTSKPTSSAHKKCVISATPATTVPKPKIKRSTSCPTVDQQVPPPSSPSSPSSPSLGVGHKRSNKRSSKSLALYDEGGSDKENIDPNAPIHRPKRQRASRSLSLPMGMLTEAMWYPTPNDFISGPADLTHMTGFDNMARRTRTEANVMAPSQPWSHSPLVIADSSMSAGELDEAAAIPTPPSSQLDADNQAETVLNALTSLAGGETPDNDIAAAARALTESVMLKEAAKEREMPEFESLAVLSETAVRIAEYLPVAETIERDCRLVL
ncbi:hypothetical protein BC937DRAFT_91041 [Endogone sp. FLAS-F59071]|nr:hypothetical protein BC937DRAFT_91041 [Endogone sp. FLAS-F59071]|eukprot:RUS21922.1 hypothetical protein BC937DRAFT_91041 [Endogone sp. FLAS-F59071]